MTTGIDWATTKVMSNASLEDKRRANRTVKVTVKNVYGADKYYAANHTAEILLGLTGCKTFRSQDFRILEMLGFNVEATVPVLPR